jgi:hypothetical protein
LGYCYYKKYEHILVNKESNFKEYISKYIKDNLLDNLLEYKWLGMLVV